MRSTSQSASFASNADSFASAFSSIGATSGGTVSGIRGCTNMFSPRTARRIKSVKPSIHHASIARPYSVVALAGDHDDVPIWQSPAHSPRRGVCLNTPPLAAQPCATTARRCRRTRYLSGSQCRASAGRTLRKRMSLIVRGSKLLKDRRMSTFCPAGMPLKRDPSAGLPSPAYSVSVPPSETKK